MKFNREIYFLVSSLIIISNDTYLFGTSGIKVFELIRIGYIFLVFIYLLLKNNLTGIQLLILCGFLCLFFISSITNSGGMTGGPILLFITLYSAFSIVNQYSIELFSRVFSNIICILCIYSLVIWTGVSIEILPVSVSFNIAEAPIKSSFGCIFFDLYGAFGLRNSCIFREPGVFMIFINIAFILESFILKNIEKKRFMIYAVSMFSTFSTAGFLIFGLIFLVYTLEGNGGILNTNSIIPLLFLMAVISIMSFTELGEGVFGKINEGESSHSYLGRISSLTIPYEIICRYPLLGCGIERFESLYTNIGYSQYGVLINPQGLATNTLLNSSATFGIWYGLFLIVGLYKFIKKLHIEAVYRLIIWCSLILCLCNEVLTYSVFIYWFIFYGYKQKRRQTNV